MNCECVGLCMCNLHKESIDQVNLNKQERAQEDGFTQKQCEQIRRMVADAFCKTPVLDQVWIDGFLKGFNEGKCYGD